MNILIVYDSWTGNTRALCNATASALRTAGHSVLMGSVNEVSDTQDFDLVIVGTPVHFGPTTAIKNWLRRHGPVPVMAVIMSYGAPDPLGWYTVELAMDSLRHHTRSIIGAVAVRGFHPILRTYPGHPTDNDLSMVAKWAQGMTGDGPEITSSPSYSNWINQNLPFFCGLIQGMKGESGLHPDEYVKDPYNFCSSPKWYRRGYNITQSIF